VSALLVVRRATKAYGRLVVLDLAGLMLHRGDRVLLTGHNGSGKSTLLRLLAGVSVPTEGTVQRTPEASSPRVAFVPQAGGLIPDLSVDDNLREHGLLYGVRDPAWCERLLEETGLSEHRRRRFAELSGGLQRVAALCAALSVKPDWLFVDEPLTGVDRQRRDDIRRLIGAQVDELTLFVATAPEDTELPTNRAIALRNGRIVQGDA
jgi:ABC-type multidrug transport system ATPase subunit